MANAKMVMDADTRDSLSLWLGIMGLAELIFFVSLAWVVGRLQWNPGQKQVVMLYQGILGILMIATFTLFMLLWKPSVTTIVGQSNAPVIASDGTQSSENWQPVTATELVMSERTRNQITHSLVVATCGAFVFLCALAHVNSKKGWNLERKRAFMQAVVPWAMLIALMLTAMFVLWYPSFVTIIP